MSVTTSAAPAPSPSTPAPQAEPAQPRSQQPVAASVPGANATSRPSASASQQQSSNPLLDLDCRACSGAKHLLEAFGRFSREPSSLPPGRPGAVRTATTAASSFTAAAAGAGSQPIAPTTPTKHLHSPSNGGDVGSQSPPADAVASSQQRLPAGEPGASAHASAAAVLSAGSDAAASVVPKSVLPADSTPPASSLPAPPLPPLLPCPADGPDLGRSTWTFLHTMAAYYPSKPTFAQQSLMGAMLGGLGEFYPCHICAEHLRSEMVQEPPAVTDNVSLSNWMCRMHNRVNVLLGKPEFDCSRVLERWRDGRAGDGDCSESSSAAE